MRRVLLAALIAAPLPAMADCLSIGPAAEFCPGDAWTFEKYVDEGVVHIAADGKAVYHLHRLREVGEEGLDAEGVFEKHAANFILEYGGEAYSDVASSQGERVGGGEPHPPHLPDRRRHRVFFRHLRPAAVGRRGSSEAARDGGRGVSVERFRMNLSARRASK